MFDLKLFLGIPADAEFQQALSQVNPNVLSLFMGGGDYLSEFSHNEQRYLGKPVPISPSVNQLESLEAHLLSLLRKLAPEYSFSKNPPVLVTNVR